MYANVNGAEIFFDIEGSGNRVNGDEMESVPACFVLHGGPGLDHTYFKPWLEPLSEHVQLIYVDHRGNGKSEKTGPVTYSIEQMADDLEALRKYLGLEEVHVIGNSFGGFVAQQYAIRYHDSLKNLVLITTAPSADFWEEAQEIAEEKATEEQLDVLTDLFDGEISSKKKEYEDWWEVMLPLYFHDADPEVVEQILNRAEGSLTVANFIFDREIPDFDVRSHLPQVTTPTQVISGRHDWVTPVSQLESIHNLLPNSELVVFENSGHMPFIEGQDKFIEETREFLASNN